MSHDTPLFVLKLCSLLITSPNVWASLRKLFSAVCTRRCINISSAYIIDWMPWGRLSEAILFIDTLNSVGDKTPPWGVPRERGGGVRGRREREIDREKQARRHTERKRKAAKRPAAPGPSPLPPLPLSDVVALHGAECLPLWGRAKMPLMHKQCTCSTAQEGLQHTEGRVHSSSHFLPLPLSLSFLLPSLSLLLL